jgi:hypothetical protein
MMPAYKNTLSNNILLSNHTKMKNKIIPYPSEFQNPIKNIMETETNINKTNNHLSPLRNSLKDDPMLNLSCGGEHDSFVEDCSMIIHVQFEFNQVFSSREQIFIHFAL